MKEIILLFFTLLGICKGIAQNNPGNNFPDSLQKWAADSILTKEKATVKLFPNPAKNKIELEVRGFERGLIQVQIIDISGKRVRDDQRLLVSGNENMVVMFSLQPGIYFIVLKQNLQSVKKKLVVQ
jgi:hypothetical protein